MSKIEATFTHVDDGDDDEADESSDVSTRSAESDRDVADAHLIHNPALYSPLPFPDSIRILSLSPSEEPDAEIRGELVSTRISDCRDAHTSYMTLSYVWGRRRNPELVDINKQKVSVRKNLADALRHLRHTSRPVRLWVDAICIDQINLKERNHQVQQMRHIYASSSETVIYLGNDDGSNTTRAAWNFLERQSEWALDDKGDKNYGRPSALEDGLIGFRGDIADVEISLLPNHWFLRVWVLQEVVVSKLVSIQCGARRVPWDDFCKALLLNPRHHDQYGLSLQAIDRVDIVQGMFQARCAYQESRDLLQLRPTWHFQTAHRGSRRSIDIVEMLTMARQLEASDPRDKVFALLGISTNVDLDDARVSVDYDKSVAQVYADLARYVMETSQSLDILSHTVFTSPFGGPPSWAPDWNRSKTARWIETCRHDRGVKKLAKRLAEQKARMSVIEDSPDYESEDNDFEEATPEEDGSVEAEDELGAVGTDRSDEEEDASEKEDVAEGRDASIDKDQYYFGALGGPDTNTSLPIDDFIGPTILSSLEKETEEAKAKRKAMVMKSMRWSGSSKLRLEIVGSCIGRINFVGPRITLRGLDESSFERISDKFQNDPREMRREIIRRWRGFLLQVQRGNWKNAHEDPDFEFFKDPEYKWSLLDDDPDLGPDTIESHLFARGRKTTTWSSEQEKQTNFITDKSSVVEKKTMGTFYSLIRHSADTTRVILPPGASAEDFIVIFRGARVPFVIRRMAHPSTCSPQPYSSASDPSGPARTSEVPELSGFQEGMPFEQCRLVGECLINDFNYWAELAASHETVFALD